MAAKNFAIIAGVGPGTSGSIARRFAKNYAVVLLGRNPDNYEPLVKEINGAGGQAIGISTDVSDRQSVTKAFARIKHDLGDHGLAAAVFNASSGFFRKPFLELTPDEWETAWVISGRGAFNFSQAVLPLLEKSTHLQYPPTLIFTGATASVKANAGMAVFATGKWALRAMAQSLAREYGPKGVHVAHAVIDGVIDIPRTKQFQVNNGASDGKIDPDAIAESYWNLHTQHRSCFTWEIDVRPYVEKW